MNNPVLASAFVIDPAAIMQSWFESQHWTGLAAIALTTAMITAAWKMPPIENNIKAQMVSDLFKTGRYVVIILLVVEFYELGLSMIFRAVEYWL